MGNECFEKIEMPERFTSKNFLVFKKGRKYIAFQSVMIYFKVFGIYVHKYNQIK